MGAPGGGGTAGARRVVKLAQPASAVQQAVINRNWSGFFIGKEHPLGNRMYGAPANEDLLPGVNGFQGLVRGKIDSDLSIFEAAHAALPPKGLES